MSANGARKSDLFRVIAERDLTIVELRSQVELLEAELRSLRGESDRPSADDLNDARYEPDDEDWPEWYLERRNDYVRFHYGDDD